MRRPSIRSAGVDLLLAGAALAAGWIGAPITYAALILAAAAVIWAWTRSEALAHMDWRARATKGALALAVLVVVLGLAYWFGLVLGGHI